MFGRPVASTVAYWRNRARSVKEVSAEVEAIADDRGASLLWAVANAPHTIDVALQVAQDTGMPLALMVWDMPQYIMSTMRFDPLSQAFVLRRFARLIREAHSIAVASAGMREHFREVYGVDSIPIVHGYPRSAWLPIRRERRDPAVRIAFAGSLRGTKEWNCLMQAVTRANGRVAGRTVAVDFVGSRPTQRVHWSSRVVCHGRKLPDEVPPLLNRATLAYLPYWFDRCRSLAVRTSFPSKMSAYLAAGVPVLYHGPEHSTPAEFVSRYPVGVCCHTLRPSDLLRCVERLLADTWSSEQFAEARYAALDQELGEHIMLARFRIFIDRAAH